MSISEKKRILICGNVNWDHTKDKQIELLFRSFNKNATIIHGGCRGVAKVADVCAEKKGLKREIFKPNFDKYQKHKALDKRNKDMIDLGKPDLVIGISSKNSPLLGCSEILNYAAFKKNIKTLYIDFDSVNLN